MSDNLFGLFLPEIFDDAVVLFGIIGLNAEFDGCGETCV
jgi:hypothetical protein